MKLSPQIYNTLSMRTDALARCYDNMVMGTFISIQMQTFGDSDRNMLIEVVNQCKDLIDCENNQPVLLYSDSTSPVGGDWYDVTENANLKIEKSMGFYSFNAYRTGM